MGRFKLPGADEWGGSSPYAQRRSMPFNPREKRRGSILQGERFGINEVMQILALGEAVIKDEGIIGTGTHLISKAYRQNKLDSAREQAIAARELEQKRITDAHYAETGMLPGQTSPGDAISNVTPPASLSPTPGEHSAPPIPVDEAMTAIRAKLERQPGATSWEAPDYEPIAPRETQHDKAMALIKKFEKGGKATIPWGNLTADERKIVESARKAKNKDGLIKDANNVPTGGTHGFGPITLKDLEDYLDVIKQEETDEEPKADTAEEATAKAETPAAKEEAGGEDFAERTLEIAREMEETIRKAPEERERRRRVIREKKLYTEKDLMREVSGVRSPEELIELMEFASDIVDTDPAYAPRSLGDLMGRNKPEQVAGIYGRMRQAYSYLNRGDKVLMDRLDQLGKLSDLYEKASRQRDRDQRRRISEEREQQQSQIRQSRIDQMNKRLNQPGAKFGQHKLTEEQKEAVQNQAWARGEDGRLLHEVMSETDPGFYATWSKADVAWYKGILTQVDRAGRREMTAGSKSTAENKAKMTALNKGIDSEIKALEKEAAEAKAAIETADDIIDNRRASQGQKSSAQEKRADASARLKELKSRIKTLKDNREHNIKSYTKPGWEGKGVR